MNKHWENLLIEAPKKKCIDHASRRPTDMDYEKGKDRREFTHDARLRVDLMSSLTSVQASWLRITM